MQSILYTKIVGNSLWVGTAIQREKSADAIQVRAAAPLIAFILYCCRAFEHCVIVCVFIGMQQHKHSMREVITTFFNNTKAKGKEVEDRGEKKGWCGEIYWVWWRGLAVT